VSVLTSEHPRDDLAAYAVDALDPVERLPVEEHLASCPNCRAELDTYRETLSWTIDDELPPPSVWGAILERTVTLPRSGSRAGASGVTDERSVPSDPASRRAPPASTSGAPAPPLAEPRVMPAYGASPPADAPVQPGDVVRLPARPRQSPPRHLGDVGRPGMTRRVALGALAAAAAVVIAVGVVPQVWDRLGDDGQPGAELADAPVGPIVANDGTEVARVRVDDDGTYLEMTGAIAPLGPGQGYQFWSTGGEVAVSLGLLGREADGEVRVAVPEGTTEVAITIEPLSGSPTPMGPTVGVGRLS
jgi:anti-sigma factor RsiW